MSGIESTPYQQSLKLKIPDRDDFSTFVAKGNENTVSLLKQAVISSKNEFYYLFGPKGCGKTHILNALYLEDCKRGGQCLFLDMADAVKIGPFILEVELPDAVLLDNIDVIAGNDAFEEAVFALFNRWYDKRQGVLVMSSSSSFDEIGFVKKDLTTRLSSGITCPLNYLNDEGCIEALRLKAEQRGFAFPEATAAFLVRHCNHDMLSLVEILNKLDDAQIEHSHELTVPFVKKVLSI
ncbi:MAG: DnaA ATPase domain-containing protein [Succinivibrio sp.]